MGMSRYYKKDNVNDIYYVQGVVDSDYLILQRVIPFDRNENNNMKRIITYKSADGETTFESYYDEAYFIIKDDKVVDIVDYQGLANNYRRSW